MSMWTVTRKLRLVLAAASMLLTPLSSGAEIIDRILAVVDRELITMSDVGAALRLGLVAEPRAGTDAVRETLDALIARQLELGEVKRYQPPEPPVQRIQAALEGITARFRTPEELQQALALSGMTLEQLRLRLRDDLLIEAYVSQRFGAAIQPSEQEVADYYRTHGAELAAGGGLPPFDDVRQTIQARLAGGRRSAIIRDWLDGLRRRTEIADLYVATR
jgi:peptidyl-prolyl cis-trans isomerase SurA